MAPRDTRFTRPSITALGMGAVGVVSVGLISTGLWYDSHRSEQAVERARQQVNTAQTAHAAPEPVAASSSERSTGSSTPESTGNPTESPEPPESVEVEAAAPAAIVPTEVAVPRQAAPRPATTLAATAPQPSVQSPAQPRVSTPATPATTGDGAAAEPTGDATGEPSEQEITQPVEPRPAPGGVLPGLIDLVRPFLPQPNVAQQAPAADVRTGAGTGVADEGQANADDAG